MKVLVFSLVLFMSSSVCTDMKEIRTAFHDIDSEEQLNSFIDSYQNSPCNEACPYLAVASMWRAEYCLWPGTQLRYFNEGKKELEMFLSSHPHSVEGRYLRVLVQSETPSFLGYNKDISADCAFIKNNIGSSNLDSDFQNDILELINQVQNK